MRNYIRKWVTRFSEYITKGGERVSLKFSNLFMRNPGEGLLLLDDVFPHQLSSFRITEFNYYLNSFEHAHVYSTGSAFPLLFERRNFNEILAEYIEQFPQFSSRIHKYKGINFIGGKLAYMIFLNNAIKFIEFLEIRKIPFVFTLYPGGGFQLNQQLSDDKLQRICRSPYLRKIITTQKITNEYLLSKKFCDTSMLCFQYGGVLALEKLKIRRVAKKYYKQDKSTFDICFVANKYMPGGLDKGFDLFIDTAQRLTKLHSDILFHVVGPYDSSDSDTNDLENIVFHGLQQTHFFPSFYSRMDIILSPNIPFILSPGAFDGFPTGACVEAGFCGVAVFCTDVLNQNLSYQDGEDLVIIEPDFEKICETVHFYYENLDELYNLSTNGQALFSKVFNLKAQMEPRLEVISKNIT